MLLLLLLLLLLLSLLFCHQLLLPLALLWSWVAQKVKGELHAATDSEEIEDVCLSQWTNSMAGLLAVQGRDHICTASRSCLAVIRDISCCFKGVGTVTFCFVNHHPYPPPPPPYTPLPATPTYPHPPSADYRERGN